ncbi:hypothetical protein [Streptomyces sp. NPDC019890]|uniref:hypothetical protein n=1 Tax=Streptomyces sp. NPDC019890 TaxID=3365064 RepID=UPI003850BFFE
MAAASLDEWQRAQDAGRLADYEKKYGLTAESPVSEWEGHDPEQLTADASRRSGKPPADRSQPVPVDPSVLRSSWHHLGMAAALPRTIRAVDTEQLLDLEQEATALGFSQRLPADWLRQHTTAGATHYLFPALEHHLSHRPEVSPQWRCQLLMTVMTGDQVLSLLDVLPATFDELLENLDAASKADIANRVERAQSLREWAEQLTAEASPERGPRN